MQAHTAGGPEGERRQQHHVGGEGDGEDERGRALERGEEDDSHLQHHHSERASEKSARVPVKGG